MYGTMAHVIFVNPLVSIYMFELMDQMNLLGEGCYQCDDIICTPGES